jgi:hypothetical protein
MLPLIETHIDLHSQISHSFVKYTGKLNRKSYNEIINGKRKKKKSKTPKILL